MSAVLDEERSRVVDAYERRGDADRYDPRRSDQVAIAAARARVWGRALLDRDPVGTVLEVGCGAGAVTRWAVDIGAERVIGIDLLCARVATARTRNPAVRYALADGRAIPARSGSVDIVLCSTLFSSVLDDEFARVIAREMDRVLARHGVIAWFDFFRDNPGNPDVRGVTRRDIEQWFPGYTARLERVVLAPPVARRLERHPRAAGMLESLPMLRTHLAGTLIRG